MWEQLELFDWNDPDVFLPLVPVVPKRKRTRTPVDYEKLYKLFRKGPVTFHEIEVAAGVSHNAVSQIITTLSLRYPIYEVKRGLYKLYGPDDYGDGINHNALNGR